MENQELKQTIKLIEQTDFFNMTVSLAINNFEDLKMVNAYCKEVSEIRDAIFLAYETEYQKPLTRTTWSNWLRGISEPNAIQKKIINNAIINYHNGRTQRENLGENN